MVNSPIEKSPALANAIIIASKHQAITSAMAAALNANVPNSVFCMPLAFTILANTGKAVMLNEIPINKAKMLNRTLGIEKLVYK